MFVAALLCSVFHILTGVQHVLIQFNRKVEPSFLKKKACFDRGRFGVGPVRDGRSLMSATPGVWVVGWSFVDRQRRYVNFVLSVCVSTNTAVSTGSARLSNMADTIVSTAAGRFTGGELGLTAASGG